MWVLYEAASVRTSGKNSEVALSSCPALALAVPYLSRWETAKKRFAPPVTSFQVRHGNGDLASAQECHNRGYRETKLKEPREQGKVFELEKFIHCLYVMY